MKNTHLEHPEDSILNDGRSGAINVLKWFADKNSTLTVKYDGAPAIVWGVNPENGKFFVGTKSVFNKKKIKINYTHNDIEVYHGDKPHVASILHMCMENLPRLSGVYQGDFIGFGGKDSYRPNTITYEFPGVVNQDIVFAAHTSYVGATMKTMQAQFGFNVELPESSNYNFLDTTAVRTRQPNRAKLLIALAKVLVRFVQFPDQKVGAYVKTVINKYIREGKELDPKSLSEETGLSANLFHLYNLLIEIKELIIDNCRAFEDVACYVKDEECEHEGYVMTNKYGTYKLVRRRIFSYNNFNVAKNWSD